MGNTAILRSELYELVWQQPGQRLAAKYGISDVALAKICKKHDIPRPPRGYWAKKQHGQNPRQLPLPPADKDVEIRLYEAPPRPSLGEAAAREIAREEEEGFKISVADSLRGAHPLVSKALGELQAGDVTQHKIISPPADATLHVAVSKGQLRRALRIMDAVIKALEQRGHRVSAGPKVEILGTTVSFGMSELTEVKHEPVEEHDLSGEYRFGHSRFNVKRLPCGRLELAISTQAYSIDGGHRHWRDTVKKPLEARLNQFVAGLIAFAERRRQREERERVRAELERQAEARRREEARRRAERHQLQKVEEERVDGLVRDAVEWRAAQELRDYIQAVWALLEAEGTSESNPQTRMWYEWAMAQADRLDPLRPSPPSILDEDLGPEPTPHQRRW